MFTFNNSNIKLLNGAWWGWGGFVWSPRDVEMFVIMRVAASTSTLRRRLLGAECQEHIVIIIIIIIMIICIITIINIIYIYIYIYRERERSI